jgi:tRNA A37 methylthiotransferase MiaB
MCEALGQLGIWVRLHYVYPYPHVDAVIDLMAQGKILPYLDIPFQHASPRILKLMKRPAHSENTLERLKLWREKCPDLVIRSTFVVGFPGETEEDFVMLLEWLKEALIHLLKVRQRTTYLIMCLKKSSNNAMSVLWKFSKRFQPQNCKNALVKP